MQLIGMLDSPFVRRTAISLDTLGFAFELRPLSVFSDFDAFSQLNPLVKAPTLICDDGTQLVDSTLIIDYAHSASSGGTSLLPGEPAARRTALRQVGVALVVAEKAVQIVYERKRESAMRDPVWLARVTGQLLQALAMLEGDAAALDSPWLGGSRPSQADITTVVSWGFGQLMLKEIVPPKNHPALAALANRAERLPSFQRWAIPAV